MTYHSISSAEHLSDRNSYELNLTMISKIYISKMILLKSNLGIYV